MISQTERVLKIFKNGERDLLKMLGLRIIRPSPSFS
jgi:hypothetical protein